MFKKEKPQPIPKFKLNVYNPEHQAVIREFENDFLADQQQYHSSGFEGYLVRNGAWVVNDSYPGGAVKDPVKYQELMEKFNALNHLRFLKEKNTLSVEDRKRTLDEIRQGLQTGFKA